MAVESKPLAGLRVGLIKETVKDGVDSGVSSAITDAANHLEVLGATITEVASCSHPSVLLIFHVIYLAFLKDLGNNFFWE